MRGEVSVGVGNQKGFALMLTGKNHGFRLLQKEESAGQTNETTGVPLLDASMAQPRTVVNHTERREAWMCFAELRVDFQVGLWRA